ncbi:MAG TPA: hypothetical protein VIL77_01560 [Gaiellaceae bacterium]
MTPFEIMTSKLASGNGSRSASASTHSTLRDAHLRCDERVGAGSGAEVEDTLPRREPPEGERVRDTGERLRRELQDVRALGRVVRSSAQARPAGRMKSLPGSRETDE